MHDEWRRYRAFTGGLSTDAEKQEWLPKGSREWPDDYTVRIKLTHAILWSEWAVDRMAGGLTKKPVQITWPEKSIVSESVRTKVGEFVANADGTRRTLASWWGDAEPEVLAMGIMGIEVARDPGMLDTIPYLAIWDAEEILDWKADGRGDLEWVLLSRKVEERATWDGAMETRTYFRVLTRDKGIEYVYDSEGKVAGEPREWLHNLGVVPFVPAYARRKDVMKGRSYVRTISLGDWRILQLESDQAHASYLHGSPVLKIWTATDLKTVGVGNTQALKFKPGGQGQEREDAEYLSLDAAGMEIREGIIDRTMREALQKAGIDPGSVIGPEGVRAGPRSGTSVALSFATSESPIMTSLSEEMDAADRAVLERVVRYLTPGKANARPDEALCDAIISRPKEWDMVAADTAIDRGGEVYDRTPSVTHRRTILKDWARKVPDGLSTEVLAKIDKEIEAADVAKPERPEDAPPPGDMGDDEMPDGSDPDAMPAGRMGGKKMTRALTGAQDKE